MFRLLVGLFLVAAVVVVCTRREPGHLGRSEVPSRVAGFYGQLKQATPEKCCVPAYFTVDAVAQITFIDDDDDDDSLEVETQMAKTTYDSIGERMTSKIHLGFTNGTKETATYIDLYEQGVGYEVYDLAEGQECYKYTLDTPFPEDCITDDWVYMGTSTVGDRAIEANTWYLLTSHIVGGVVVDEDRVLTVQGGSCVGLSLYSRYYEAGTDNQLSTVSCSFINFALGICDEKVFEVPQICEEAQDVVHRKGRRIHRVSESVAYVAR